MYAYLLQPQYAPFISKAPSFATPLGFSTSKRERLDGATGGERGWTSGNVTNEAEVPPLSLLLIPRLVVSPDAPIAAGIASQWTFLSAPGTFLAFSSSFVGSK